MKIKSKRRVIALVAVLASGFLCLNVVAYRHAYTMLHFSGKQRTERPEQLSWAQKTKVLLWGVEIPRPQTKASPLELGPETKSLRINSADGVSLGAWYYPGSNQDSLVILFHGYSSEKSGTLPEAKAFLGMGLHGAADPRARIQEARQVFAAVPGFKQFKEFAHIGHQAAVVRYPEEWKTAVEQFLKEAENVPPQTSGPKL